MYKKHEEKVEQTLTDNTNINIRKKRRNINTKNKKLDKTPILKKKTQRKRKNHSRK